MAVTGAGGTARQWPRLVLAVGCLVIAGAIRVAHADPASAYEVSIYRATPALFWLGLAVGVGLALVVAVYSQRDRILALVAAGVGVAAVVALPLIRGYHFYGLSDPFQHLGHARHILYADLNLFSIIYPGPHSFAIAIANVTGYSVRFAMLLVVVLFALVFLVFVPLSLHALFGDRRLTALGTFSALLFLPVNNVSTFVVFHPFSLAMLFSPFILYLLFKYLGRSLTDGTLPGPLSAGSVGLAVGTAALNFFHPQMTLDVLVVFGAVLAVQVLLRRYRPGHPLARSRMLVGQFVFLLALFLVWNTGHWKLVASVQNNVESLVGTLEGTQQVGSDVTNRVDSARILGVSPVVLFVKLFGVSVLYALLAAWLVGWNFLDQRTRRARSDDSVLVTYFAVGGVALAPYFILQFLGRVSNHFFRHLGFVMVVVTIIGTVGLLRAAERRGWGLSRWSRPALVVVASLLLVASLVVVFPSPYVFKPNPHTTEQHMEGYTAAFESQEPGGPVWFGGIGGGGAREKSALRGQPGSSWEANGFVQPPPRLSGPVPAVALDNISEYYATHREPVVRRDHYVPLSEVTVQTELVAKQELRYTQRDLENFTRHPDVYRVRSNGGFGLYYVDTACDPVCEEAQE